MKNLLSTTNNSSLTSSKSVDSYKIVNAVGEIITVELNPESLANEPKTLSVITSMISLSGEQMTKGQIGMLSLAISNNNVKTKEIIPAFWHAYGYPYVSGGRIEFRHLMKYITTARNSASNERYTRRAILDMAHEGSAVLEEFSCLNGEDGKPRELDVTGKPLWVRK